MDKNPDLTNLDLMRSKKKLILIVFESDWCGCCHMMNPIIDKIAEQFKEKVKICKLDYEDHKEMSERYGILNAPAIIFIRNGQVEEKVQGTTSRKDLEERINTLLA